VRTIESKKNIQEVARVTNDDSRHSRLEMNDRSPHRDETRMSK